MAHPALGTWIAFLATVQFWSAVRLHEGVDGEYGNHPFTRILKLGLCTITGFAAYYLGTGN